MITSLSIRNFQAHEKLRIDFAPGVTAIVGPTNCGKSAVMRSLILAIRNKPTGTSFIRTGSDTVRVKLELSDSEPVTRYRSPDDNCYMLGKEPLRAMAADVPDKITAALRIADASIQQQHDAPYMLGLSPRALAEEINRITGCDDTDVVLESSRELLREAKATTKVRKADLTAAIQNLANTKPTEELEAKLHACTELADKIAELSVAADDLAELLSDIPEVPKEISVDLSNIDEIVSGMAEIKRSGSALSSIISELRGAADVAECDFPPESESISLALQKANKEIRSLSALLNDLAGIKFDCEAAEKKEKTAIAEFAEIQKLKCPLCGK